MKDVLKEDEVEESTIAHHSHYIHRTEWEGSPDVYVIQAWDSSQNKWGWGYLCLTQQQHDKVGIILSGLRQSNLTKLE